MNYDPREPAFPAQRDFRRRPEWAVPAALLLWWALPLGLVALAGWWVVTAPISPAPFALALAVSLLVAIHGRD